MRTARLSRLCDAPNPRRDDDDRRRRSSSGVGRDDDDDGPVKNETAVGAAER